VKKLLSLMLTLLLVFSLSTTVFAAGSVTYDGNANKFVVAPENLFSAFQDVMPGDTLTEQIEIKNTTSKDYKIKAYMRSLGAQEGTDDFLAQMKLTVKPSTKSSLFEAPADETAQLTDWVYLGTIRYGGKITLDVKLEVPITMGDDYQNETGYIDWQFKVEEIPLDPDQPATGDGANIALYGGLLALSLLALAVLMFARKRRSAEK